MYKCLHFKIHELVPPSVYQDRGQKAWKLFDMRILMAADALRVQFGSCTINDWKWGGKFKYSGFRPAGCKTGSKYSDHRYGRGLDLKFKNATPKEVRKWIKQNAKTPFTFDSGVYRLDELITCIEKDTPTWTHIACRNTTPIEEVPYK